MATTTSPRLLSAFPELYEAAYKIYSGLSCRLGKLCEWLDPAVLDSILHVPKDVTFKALSVGGGDGYLESKFLAHLWDRRAENSEIHAVIVEPDADSIHRYQELVSKEPDKLGGITYDWRQQTFQEYETSPEAARDKFHFISCISSIYFLGDLEKSMKTLYDKLDDGGVLLVGTAQGEIGWGRLQQYVGEQSGAGASRAWCTASEVKDVCEQYNIPISEIRIVKTWLDVSVLFPQSPHQLSEDGKALLDFMTGTVDFSRDAGLRDDVLAFLGSEACTERGPAGEVMLDESTAMIIIRRE